MAEQSWWVLVYKIPSEPSRLRATIWREVHRMGAVYLQDGVCLLPDALDMELGVDALRERIVELGGKAWTFKAASAAGGQDRELESLFKASLAGELSDLRDGARALCRHLEEAQDHYDLEDQDVARSESELRRLQALLQSTRSRQYFKEPLSDEIEATLYRCHVLLTGGGAKDEVGDQG